MPDAPTLTPVYITTHSMVTGVVEEALATIRGDLCLIVLADGHREVTGEGFYWHRAKWAAENWCRQEQERTLDWHRDQIARIEKYRFGRPGR